MQLWGGEGALQREHQELVGELHAHGQRDVGRHDPHLVHARLRERTAREDVSLQQHLVYSSLGLGSGVASGSVEGVSSRRYLGLEAVDDKVDDDQVADERVDDERTARGVPAGAELAVGPRVVGGGEEEEDDALRRRRGAAAGRCPLTPPSPMPSYATKLRHPHLRAVVEPLEESDLEHNLLGARAQLRARLRAQGSG